MDPPQNDSTNGCHDLARVSHLKHKRKIFDYLRAIEAHLEFYEMMFINLIQLLLK